MNRIAAIRPGKKKVKKQALRPLESKRIGSPARASNSEQETIAHSNALIISGFEPSTYHLAIFCQTPTSSVVAIMVYIYAISSTYSWIGRPISTSRQKINLPKNQKEYDTLETTVGKLSARRIQICFDYFCLGIILKVILNNFQNNA